MNAYYGNGAATSKTPGTTNSNNFGLGIIGTSEGNLVEKNKIGGNVNGLYVSSPRRNEIRNNIIAGNPPVQVSLMFGNGIGADIRELSPAGTHTFEENHCLTYAGSTTPAPCPNISEVDDDGDVETHTAATPFQGSFQHAYVWRNRLAFPRARLINAVFHVSGRALPKTAGPASPGQTADSQSVTVTGKVVDAACYMLHPQAANAASHKDCGAACLARGVPLAIAAGDGTLYFPADGNQRLKTLLNARVRVSGTIAEKHEPMELKMPVGDKTQMVVRVEGGYKQITIQALEKLPAAKRPPA